jgi:hypothetical protein
MESKDALRVNRLALTRHAEVGILKQRDAVPESGSAQRRHSLLELTPSVVYESLHDGPRSVDQTRPPELR